MASLTDTLPAFLPEYFRLNSRIQSPLTRDQYRFAVRDFSESLLREPLISDLCEDALAKLRSLLQHRKLAAKTINERVGRLVTIWRWLADRGVIATHPTVSRLVEPHRIPQAWTLAQMRRVIDAVSVAHGSVAGIPQGLWWRSLVLALWDTGERITAMLTARWSDLDTSTGWLLLPAESRKGQCTDAAYRLTQPTLDAILEIIQPVRQLIWPWPHDRSYLWIRYGTLLRRAGLPTGRYSGFHRIRRTVASYYELAGGDASQLLGHRDRRTTAAYIDPRIVQPPQASDRLPRIDSVSQEKYRQ